jgi:hypothetical protein
MSSFAILHTKDFRFQADVSEQNTDPIFKIQAVFLDYWNLKSYADKIKKQTRYRKKHSIDGNTFFHS